MLKIRPFFFTAILLQNLITPAIADDFGSIGGQIIDVKNNQKISGQTVILKIHNDDKTKELTTPTDDNGNYLFDQLIISLETHYTIYTNYQNNDYYENDLVLNEWTPNITVDLKLNAFTDQASEIDVTQHAIILTQAEGHEHGKALHVMEVIQLKNNSDRAFQSKFEEQNAGVFFYLPTKYENLQKDENLKVNRDKNFIFQEKALEPNGELSVGFSYLMHFEETVDLSRKATFDTEEIYIFIDEKIPLSPSTKNWHTDRREIHGRTYNLYTTGENNPIEASQTITLKFNRDKTVTNIKTENSGDPKNFSSSEVIAIALASIVLGGFIVAMALGANSTTTEKQNKNSIAGHAQWLKKLNSHELNSVKTARLEMIAHLDDIVAEKSISRAIHKRLRNEQENQLTETLEQLTAMAVEVSSERTKSDE